MNALEQKITARAAENGGAISQAELVNFCLYDAQFGYYKSPKTRVGGRGDFFTAASLKCGVFGRLLKSAALAAISASGAGAGSFEIVEIGAEPGTTAVPGARAIRLGEPVKIPPRAAVFANELLDARPPERFIFSGGVWQKLFFEFGGGGFKAARKVLRRASEAETRLLEKYFPRARVENFALDISFDAAALFENICRQNWRGALLFADYFRSAAELEQMPRGTLRTYFRHTQGGDILENAGLADITYSPCSQIFERIAFDCGFCNVSTQTQEAFFVSRAAAEAEKIMSNPDPIDPQKRELCALISPAHMGACFRILSAERF